LPAFWVGLIYDDAAMDAAWDLCRHWTQEDRLSLRNAVPAEGLMAEVAGRKVHEVAADLLDIAAEGLHARAKASNFDRDEAHFLNSLRDTVSRRESLAGELLRKYEGAWKGDVERVFAEYSY